CRTEGEAVFKVVFLEIADALNGLEIVEAPDFKGHLILAALTTEFSFGIPVLPTEVRFCLRFNTFNAWLDSTFPDDAFSCWRIFPTFQYSLASSFWVWDSFLRQFRRFI